MKKYWIETFGCQMNVLDSEVMAGLLTKMGYQPAREPEEADIILINTCTVRQKPDAKAFAYLGQFRRLKEKKPELILGLTGCMAQREAPIIKAHAPYLDILLGPRSVHRLPDLVRTVQEQRRLVEHLDLYDDPVPPDLVVRRSDLFAYVTIIHGCNKKCTFCAVPTARGPEKSVPVDQVLRQVDQLIEMGYREIILLGQNANAYGHDLPPVNGRRVDLAYLLEKVDEKAAPAKVRIRFTTNHPNQMSDRLIRAMAELESVCEHLHLPVQSGDNEVLRRMWRGYTVEQYLRIIDRLRETIPGIAIATDVIVGFPGETEEQFENTLALMEKVRFDQAFMFAFSPRPNTLAATFPDQVPERVKQERLRRLISLQNAIQQRVNESQVGEVVEVLVEGPGEKNLRKLTGRTRTNKTVAFDGDLSLRGQYVLVRTTRAYLWGFDGVLESHQPSEVPHTKGLAMGARIGNGK
ncbi:MAG: tRNA (N6-isopentenyl adenosine(37)-C2)-methylthiotransferase MiaB [Armatimonadetes bacterium]|nr:tRNA (N6-isopentenyl adenosine(37)-C2)-methylthiotransferase MiaB [Armatimonadota bacterium]MDW8122344.1 tRNA (N6-isopentenyl adenosine(37)-C2)-methylthiotransferase MiaB [Armatimonadota bacterium]